MFKVKEYMKNVAKSTVYAASSLVDEQYSTIKDFKNTNQEVFKESYNAIKDYRTTFSRVKTQIQKSDVYTAANLGINNIISDLRTGQFYNKDREAEYNTKYGGDLMSDSDWDIDDSNFDWDNKTDISDGDRVIATAIKKNNKMSTVMMADAMAQGHKAIIDSSRENTTMLYIQNERFLNKVGGGLDNITSLLRSNTENNARVQNRQMENTSRFFTNMEKKTDRVVAQLDEMLQMQRNLYSNELQKEKERKKNTVTDIQSGGVPDIKQYAKLVKGNIKDQISQFTGGIGGMGDALGGANMFAMFAANPLGEVMKWGMNKAISKDFKKASKDFDKSLKGYFSALMSKANNAKNSDDPFAKVLGTIFGIKTDKESDTMRTDKYIRGSIPFDGVTKKAITEVMPYYLRKMTSMLTGEDEKIFDYKTGKWTTIRAVQKRHNDWKNAGANSALSELTSLLSDVIGKNTSNVMTSHHSQESFKKNYEKLTEALYRSNGDLSVLNKGMENGIDQEFLEMIKRALADDQYHYYNANEDQIGKSKYYKSKMQVDRSKGVNGTRTGYNKRSTIANLSRNIYDTKAQRAGTVRQMETESDLIERILYSEGIVMDPNSKNNPGIRNKHGDYNTDKAFESPLAKAFKYVQDDYKNTIFDYLRGIKKDLTAIRSLNLGLFGSGNINNHDISSNEMNFEKGDADKLYGDVNEIRSNTAKGGKGWRETQKQDNRNRESYDGRYYRKLEQWEANGRKGPKPDIVDNFEDIKHYLSSKQMEFEKDNKKDNASKKTVYDVAAEYGFLKKEEAEKYNKMEYDTEKSFKDNTKDKKGFEKIVLLKNYANKLIQKPWEAATDAIIHTDRWISDLFFGKDLKKNKEDKEAEDKGLLLTFRDKIKDGFESLIETIGKKAESLFEKISNKLKPKLDPIRKFLFGDRNGSEDEFSGGILSALPNAFIKNGRSVLEYAKNTAKQAKKAITGKDEESDSETVVNNIRKNKNKVSEYSLTSKEAKRLHKSLVIDIGVMTKEEFKEYLKYCRDNKFNPTQAMSNDNINLFFLENQYGRNIDSTRDQKGNLHTKITSTNKYKFKDMDSVIRHLKKQYFNNDEDMTMDYISWAKENVSSNNLYAIASEVNVKSFISKNKILSSTKERVNDLRTKNGDKYNKFKSAEGSTAAEKLRNMKAAEESTEENTDAVKRITSPIEKIASLLEKIVDKFSTIPNIGGTGSPPATTARGGINTSGKSFHSVVSSGEIINGNIVPPGGPYLTTIPRGGVVINPAGSSKISKQAMEEKKFLNNIRSNAKANDGLTKASVVDVMNNPENQKFASDIIAKGGIGFGTGMLLGHPLLAAGIGIASGFSQKTNGFANAIFGTASGTDENGKVVRNDDGLLSKEIQKALPDVKKFGLGGAIAGLITPFGPLGGLLIGSAMGFAKNNGLIQDTLFGENGIFDKDKKNKLKKALPAMGIGAAAGALLGPFGLVGNLVLGATAGYATSMDKFKEALFGKEKDTGKKDKDGNPIMEKEGGLFNKIKQGLDPLKDFGKTMVDGITDSIFGKKKGKDGKREGGLFGAAKDLIVNPIAEGVKPIIQESKLMFHKTIGAIPGMVNRWMKNNVGSHLSDRMSKAGGKLGRAAIKVGAGALAVSGSPLMLAAGAVKGIGSGLRRKQIRRGEANDMTAAERISYRSGSNFMLNDNSADNYYRFDSTLANLSNEYSADDLKALRSLVLQNANGEDALLEEDSMLRQEFDGDIYKILGGGTTHKVLKSLNKQHDMADYKKAEDIIMSSNASDAEKEVLLDKLNNLKSSRKTLLGNYKNKTKKRKSKAEIDKENGMAEILKKAGVDITNKKQGNKVAKMLNREILHKEAGMTPEEDPNNPINKNTTELEENTSEVKKLTEAIMDMVKLNSGNKLLAEQVQEKYKAAIEEANQNDEVNDKNIGNKTAQAIISNSAESPEDAKNKLAAKSIMEDGARIWARSLQRTSQISDPIISNPDDKDDKGYYEIWINQDKYIYSNNATDKSKNDEEYDRFINSYIKSKIPSHSKIWKFVTKTGALSSRQSIMKLAGLALLGPLGVTVLIASSIAKKQHLGNKIKKGAGSALRWTGRKIKGVGKFAGELVAGKEVVVGQDENGNDITERQGGAISGIRNRIAGAVSNVNKKGKDASALDKILSKMDDLPHKIGKVVVGEKGDRNGILQKIFGVTKLAVGVPLMVGFMKESILPFIKNKVGPIFLGKKDENGEYQGGLISGIIKPIKNLFAERFKRIKDWFTNSGDYAAADRGMSGMIQNFKNLFGYAIDMWKSGANTIYEKWVPALVEGLVSNLPAAIGAVLKGLLKGAKKLWNSDDQTEVGKTGKNLQGAISSIKSGSSSNNSIGGGGHRFFSTFGNTININDDGSVTNSTNSGDPMASANKIGAQSLAILNSGISSGNTDIVDSGKTGSTGDKVYYAKDDTKHTTPLRIDPETGQYYKASDLNQYLDPSLSNNNVYKQMQQNEEDISGDVTANSNTFGARFTKNMIQGVFDPFKRAGRKISGTAVKLIGKGIKHMPGVQTKIVGKGIEMIGAGINKTAVSKDGIKNLIQNGKYVEPEKTGGVVKKIIGFLKTILNKVLASDPVKKLLTKMGKGSISEAAEKSLKEAAEKVAKEAGETLAKKGVKMIASIPLKLAAKVTPAGIVFVIADFVTGMSDVRNILKITSEDVDVPEKIIAGFSKVLSGLLFVLPESLCCTLILNSIGKVLFKNKVDEIEKEQKESEAALKAYNEEHGEDLTMEEYNNKYNATWYSKTKAVVNKAAKKVFNNSIFSQGKSIVEDIKSGKNFGQTIGDVVANHTIIGNGVQWVANKFKKNASANDGLTSFGMNNNTIDDSLNSATSGFDKMQMFSNKFSNQNKSVNDMINNGKIDPSDKNFWKIKMTKTGNPMMDSMLKMKEYMTRLVKAPFSMVSKTMGNVNNIIGNNDSSGSNSSTTTTTTTTDTSDKKESIWTRIKNKFKGIFGKGDGRGEGGSVDPNHIYQRDYSGSFQTSKDTERQTLADSGCGPAAAATVANRYGLKDNINNAAKYATSNGYKEVNGGTYPGYFGDYLSKKGIRTKATQSNEDVIRSLAQGKPVIMMGQDKSNSGKSPYGSKYSHYVVATGIDRNGNVIVEDSEDKKSQTKYNLIDTLKNTSVKITTSGSGRYGRGQSGISVLSEYSNSLVKSIYGPYYSALFGNDSSTDSGVNGATSPNAQPSGPNGNISSVTDSGDVESRKKTIWNYLVTNGCSKNLAAAIMGNMQRESGFDPTAGEVASGDSGAKSILNMTHPQFGAPYGCGWGLCQWSYAAGHSALYNWCTAHNLSADTLEGQLNYLMAGLKGIDVESAVNSANTSKFGWDGNGVLGYTYNNISEFGGLTKLNTLSIPDAVAAFYDLYERGANRDSDVSKSTTWAQEIYNQFANSSSGSGRGKGNTRTTENRSYRRGNSGRSKTYSPKTLYSNKYGKGIRSYYGRGDDAPTDTPTDTTTTSTPEPSKPSSALEAIGAYSGQLMKTVYGDYWTALFGDTDVHGDTKNNTAATNSAVLSVNPNCKIAAPFKGTFVVEHMFSQAGTSAYGGPHGGVDIIPCDQNGNSTVSGKPGSANIYSICNGSVSLAAPDGEYNGTGNMVHITCSDPEYKGYIFIYYHMNDLFVKTGDIITIGQAIGTIGTTGQSSGVHLHFQINKPGCEWWGDDFSKVIDPATVMGTTSNKDAHTNGERVESVYTCDLFDTTSKKKSIALNNIYSNNMFDNRLNLKENASDEEIEKAIYSSGDSEIIAAYNNELNGSGRGKGNTTKKNSPMKIANKRLSDNFYAAQIKKDKSVRTNSMKYLGNQHETIPAIWDADDPNFRKSYSNNINEINNTVSSLYGKGNNSNNINTDQIISILEIIANNSNGTEQIIQLLAAIVANTSVSSNSSGNSAKINQLINQLRSNNSSAPLTGLNQVLNNNGSNIANSVYEIAKS